MTISDADQKDLLNRLSGDDPEQTRAAIFAVADLGAEEFIPQLADFLQSPYLGVQEAADRALRKIRGAKVVEALAPFLRLEEALARNSAIDILREIGSDDLSVLYGLLRDEDRDVRIFVADILGSSNAFGAATPLSEALANDPEVNVRYQACISLGNIGGVEAVEALKKAFKDEEWVQFAAVEALTKLKAEGVADFLLTVLDKSSDLLAANIINALGSVGDISSVPVLLQRLDEEGGFLRNLTVKAVVQIIGEGSLRLLSRKDLEKLRSYFFIALEDEDQDIVQAACRGLSFIGDVKATRAIFNRISKMNKEETEALSIATLCLARIGYNEGLKEAVLSESAEVVKAVIETCSLIGCRRSIGLLIANFEGFPPDLQKIAARRLAELCDITDTSFFLELLDAYVDIDIIKASLRFIGLNVSALPMALEILRFLRHPDKEVREAALEACLSLNNGKVNEELTSLFSNKDEESRVAAAYAMGQIGVDRHLDTLVFALKDPSSEVRRAALEALGKICDLSPEVFRVIARSADDPDRGVRLSLVELAGRLASKEALELVVKMLNDKDSWVCIRAVDAICKRPDSRESLRCLIQRLEGADLLVSLRIIEALGSIGGSLAFQVLLNFSKHEDPNVQKVASEALKKIQKEQGEAPL